MSEYRNLVDGELLPGGNGTFDNINPATEEVIGQAPDASEDDMLAAIAGARRAFDETEWSRDGAFRKHCLLQLQAAIEAEKEELRQILITEVGCPALTTFGPQLDAPLREALSWPAEQIESFPWTRGIGPKDAFGMGMQTEREVWKEPVGVVGVITPWNFPVEIILNKLGPVLAMGNTMILKAAPDTPHNASWIGRIIAEKTDIPAGVVNIVNSREHRIGELITSSPLVDMIAFTGSTATGKRIMQVASETMKQVFLELGGKSVLLALPGADVEGASAAAAGMCMHAGQGCAMATRFLVPRSSYDEFLAAATERFSQVPYGDPTDFSNLMGPQVSKRQQERVLSYIEKGRAEGARVMTGGGVPEHLPKGYYVAPTLFGDVENWMTIAREEIFGPVQTVIAYDDVDDAVRIANDTTYGLSGMVMGPDLDESKAVARRIRTGTVSINGGVWYGADAPFGGYKQSGIGRQCGIEGLEIFTETKTVGWPA
jgi:aldehyde dehydrogenase (NAD+)